jgi:O-acetyl-ADP-ribose deacetylase (regulator of RNase III)
MITYGSGDLLEADTEALINTVNCVGVMGKGIALQFKRRYPAMFTAYEKACKRGEVTIGKMLIAETGQLDGPKYIINFPTKKHWRAPSNLAYIDAGFGRPRREWSAVRYRWSWRRLSGDADETAIGRKA